MEQQNPIIISCGILEPELRELIAREEIAAEVLFLPKNLHSDPRKLEKALEKVLSDRQKTGGQKPVVVYGDVCMGFGQEIKALMDRKGAVKVDALNCIDCLLGGRGELLKIDPEHVYLFLTAGFMGFTERLLTGDIEDTRKRFSMLKGIIIIDALGNLDACKERIDDIAHRTGLPVLETLTPGLGPFKRLIREALERAKG